MMNQEVFILIHNGGFDGDFAENLPVYRRHYFLHLLQVENEQIEKMQEKAGR